MNIPILPVAVAALCATAFAQTNDAPPVDVKQLLQSLRQLRDQNETTTKSRRTGAYQQVVGAASSNERAAAAWTEAVLAVQFQGVDHQATAVRDWKQSEGEALKSKEASNAARLHLQWLAMTIQRASGAETKQLLNNIIEFAKQVEIDGGMIERVGDKIAKEKERAAGMRRAPANKALADDSRTKKLHDSIMKMSVADGPVAKMLQISDIIGDIGKKRRRGDDNGEPPTWEPVPGNVDGIYKNIVLPEFRATKDPRLLEYWDLMLRRQAESIYAGMPDFEERQSNQVERPKLLWNRAQDEMTLGLRNRALTDMLGIIKGYPVHPDAAQWIAQLESFLAPPAAQPAASSSTLPPPASIPSVATRPVPTATIIPAAPVGTTPGVPPAAR